MLNTFSKFNIGYIEKINLSQSFKYLLCLLMTKFNVPKTHSIFDRKYTIIGNYI